MGGVTIDAGPFISTERAGFTPKQTLDILKAAASTDELSVSAIAYTELTHGVFRANSVKKAEARLRHLHDLFEILPVHPYSREMAELAGRLRAEQLNVGNELPFADSLIAATAIFLGRPLLTQNLRDFVRIPDLIVIPFQLG